MYLSESLRNQALDAMLDDLDGGTLRFYSGTRPAGTTLGGGETLLATCTFNADAFAAAASGAASANAITGDSSIDANGTCTFAFGVASNGTTVCCNFSVGATSSGEDIELGTTSLVAGASLDITGITLTFPAGD